MRHLTSTIQQFDLQPAQLPTRDRAATEGRAWLLRRLRWEHRLAELRSEHERAPHTTTTASTANPSTEPAICAARASLTPAQDSPASSKQPPQTREARYLLTEPAGPAAPANALQDATPLRLSACA
jgi:hypothetical protein